MPTETAAEAPTGPTPADLKVMVDTLWVVLTGMLVFFMNLGFACVESGFCRSKNCVNILSKELYRVRRQLHRLLAAGLGADVRQWERLHRHSGVVHGRRRGQQPCDAGGV